MGRPRPSDPEERIQWETHVPFFRNRFLLEGILLAFGVPFGALIVYVLVQARGDVMGTDARYVLGLIALLFVAAFLVMLVVYRGRYAPGFIIDEKGIVNYTQAGQAKRNRVVNNLVIAAGALGAHPSAVGTGMIAESRQVVRIRWPEVRKVRYVPQRHTVFVWGGFTQKVAVLCTPQNYGSVAAAIRERTPAGTVDHTGG